MEIFAYVIWGALGGCLLIGVALYIYARVRARSQDSSAVEVEAPETYVPVLNEERWEHMISRLHLHKCSIPETVEERIEWACEIPGVQKEWLAGEDVPMYPFLSFHNAVDKGVEFIHTLKTTSNEVLLYVVKPRGILLAEEIMDACAVLCFAVPQSSEGCTVWRYSPVNVYWEWGYPPERVQCSQIIYTAIKAGIEIRGVEVDVEDIYTLVEGKDIPTALIENGSTNWDPRTIASAGEDLAGVKKGMLSAPELSELIAAKGWVLKNKDECS